MPQVSISERQFLTVRGWKTRCRVTIQLAFKETLRKRTRAYAVVGERGGQHSELIRVALNCTHHEVEVEHFH